MPKYPGQTFNQIMGGRLPYGSDEREKLRLGYAHHVQIEAGTLGILEVQYFHPLSISNLTLTCACCGKTLASYSGVYKHSQKCPGIHPDERPVQLLNTAPEPIATTTTKNDDSARPNKVSPTAGDRPNWMENGLGATSTFDPNTENTENTSVETRGKHCIASNGRGIELLNADIHTHGENQNDTCESIRTSKDAAGTLELNETKTPPMDNTTVGSGPEPPNKTIGTQSKERCVIKRKRDRIGGEENQMQTRSRAKK
jgi:hypothetical protein